MLYVCIPVHNEAATVGVLLWRLRSVLQDAGRDYEVVVYDDGSTDATADVLAPYARVLPLTVLGAGRPRGGRTAATEALVRHVAATSRYPRRDACLLMQGDYTDRPEDVPALLAAFEQGADVVVGRREPDEAQPAAERRLRRMGPWVLRPLVRADEVDDLLGGPRLVRVAVVRDLVRARGAAPLAASPSWAGMVELLVALLPFARRAAVVDTPGRYDVRPRPSRLDWAAELRALARYAWRARGTHARLAAGAPRLEASVEQSPPRAPAASETSGTEPELRLERPRRAKRNRPRNADPSGPDPASTTPPPDQPHDELAGAVSQRQPTPPRRERSARPGRTPDDHASRGGSVGGGVPALATAVATDPAAVSSDAAEESGGGSAGEATPARRRKRRTRRRGRDAAAGASSEAGGVGDGPNGDLEASGDAREAEPGMDARQADTAELDDGAADLAPARRRRRRRGRGGSGERASGVPPEAPPARDDAD